MTDKLDSGLQQRTDAELRNADRINALELRLTSRLDLGTGQEQGASRVSAISEAKVNQRIMLSGVIISVVIIIAQIVIALIAHKL
jgi:hypothetical protein